MISIFSIIKRKKNKKSALLLVELGLSFIVLFILFSFAFKYLKYYIQPLGFYYTDIYALTIDNWDISEDKKEHLIIFNTLKREILSLPEVDQVSNCSYSLPFTSSYAGTTLDYKNKGSGQAQTFRVDDAFANLMGIELIEGRWFSNEDDPEAEEIIIINQQLKENLFENEPVIGKKFSSNQGKNKYKIIGVFSVYRNRGEFEKPTPAFFRRLNPEKPREELLIKVYPNTEIQFESKLIKTASSIAKDWTLNVQRLEDKHSEYLKRTLTPFILLGILCLFLIGNTILGQFAVLWYNISLRKSEIGVRIAVGANKNNIFKQFIGEMLVLATLGILPGLIIAAQFPILKVFDIEPGVYILAMLAATSIIYLLVTLCALLPSAQAASIQPAMALHEE